MTNKPGFYYSLCHIRDESLPGTDSDCESPACPSSPANPKPHCPVPSPALPGSTQVPSPVPVDAPAALAVRLPGFGAWPCPSLQLSPLRRRWADLGSGRGPHHPHTSGGLDCSLAPRVPGNASSSGSSRLLQKLWRLCCA